MTDTLIAHANLDRLLSRLADRGAVWAPRRSGSGDVELARWRRGEPLTLKYGNLLQSPKALFLPQNQTLLVFKDGKWEEPSLPDGMRFLFGIRPCDARALLLLDQVFLDGDRPSADPYYSRLRETTMVVAVACTQALSSCFCTSVGGGPGDGAGADVLAVDLQTDLLLRPQTGRGRELLSSVADLMGEATEEAVEESQERIRSVEGQVGRVRTDDSIRRLREAFDSPLWDTVGRTCLGCGTCSYLCPTCYCFDITDEIRAGRGRRVRTWDCCAYAGFTLQASGHNPRPSPRERCRQRIMHKFRYSVESFATPFCVGCGRCIRSCPAALDLRATLRDLGE